MTTIVLVDGDIIAYACGFAAEHKTYTVTGHDGKPHAFKYHADLKAYCKEAGLDIKTAVTTSWHEPLENCLHGVKETLTAIQKDVEADRMYVCLSHGESFRKKLATTKGYKANRDGTHKPVFHQEILEYLRSNYACCQHSDFEADDTLLIIKENIEASPLFDKPTIVICSTDKDLDQIPGPHYNWRKKEFYHVPEEQAVRNKWRQVLSGDATDNIPGLPGIGPAKAERLLPAYGSPEEEYMRVVKNCYLAKGKDEEYFAEQVGLITLVGKETFNETREKQTETPSTEPSKKETGDIDISFKL